MLSFDSSQFNSDSADALQSFMGDGTTSGFLLAANNALNSVEDPTDGSLKIEETLTSQSITQQNSLISTTEQKITDLQNTLTQQMAAADAAIAALENQKSYFTNLFTAMINESTLGIQAVSSGG
jgi:flagellar capping protein FliD